MNTLSSFSYDQKAINDYIATSLVSVTSVVFIPIVSFLFYQYLMGEVPFERLLTNSIGIGSLIALALLYRFGIYKTAVKNLFCAFCITFVVLQIVKIGIESSFMIGWAFVLPLTLGIIFNSYYSIFSFIVIVPVIYISAFHPELFISLQYPETMSDVVSRQNAFINFLLQVFYTLFVIYFNTKKNRIIHQHLMDANQKLIEHNMHKDRFVSNVSHELRNPLNGLYGSLQILATTQDNAKREEFTQLALNSTKNLTHIVNDVLDIEKIMSGKLVITKDWLNPNNLCSHLEFLYGPKKESSPVSFSIFSNSMPDALFIDEIRIKQILNNLVSNAFKFTHEGNISVSMEYKKKNLVITVSDTGIGMDDEALQKLFLRFEQGDISTSKKYGGTGIGMAITKELVELMGGKIEVESILGKGTTFKVSIPCGSNGSVSVIEEPSVMPSRLKDMGIRILFVDDDEINRMMGEVMLADHVEYFDMANSGYEALEKIKNNTFNLVITDIGMPQMTGEELQLRIAEQYPDLPVIALTGNAHPADKLRYLTAGFSHVLVKPVQLSELYNACYSFMEKKDKLVC